PVKNTILLILIAFLFQTSLQAQNNINPEIKGNPKTIATTKHKTQKKGKKWLMGKPISKNFRLFNEKNLLLENKNYSKGALKSRMEYLYKTPKYGKALCDRKTSKKTISTTFLIEDADIIRDFCKKFGKNEILITYVYNTEKSFTDKKQAYLLKSSFDVINKKKQIINQYNFNSLGELENKKTFKYHKKDGLKEITEYDFTDTLAKKERFSYNKATKTRTHTISDEHGLMTKKIITDFRANNTLRKKEEFIYNDVETVRSKVESYYDKKGNKISELFFTADSLQPIYEYHYQRKVDKKGNWIYEKRIKMIQFYGKKIRDKNESPKFRTRSISYYGKPHKKTGSKTLRKRNRRKSKK
ncbi:MAG: hypothetical protein U9Q34_07475, partial [Elusimicrobiota bacterium]|nr:hypothetical protein [Elusimicrobiota bacterium]